VHATIPDNSFTAEQRFSSLAVMASSRLHADTRARSVPATAFAGMKGEILFYLGFLSRVGYDPNNSDLALGSPPRFGAKLRAGSRCGSRTNRNNLPMRMSVLKPFPFLEF
jgi:hypothetical protein